MLAPELLPPQTELVDCLLEQTKNMEENLQSVSKSDFRFALHRMEVSSSVANGALVIVISVLFSGRADPVHHHFLPEGTAGENRKVPHSSAQSRSKEAAQ